MANIKMSDEAYKDFKSFLDESKVESYNIRIHISDYSCGGPIFNLTVDEAGEDDITETVNDITFVIEQALIDVYGGFHFVSNEENNGGGIGMKPIIPPQSGCGGCGGSCGGDSKDCDCDGTCSEGGCGLEE